MTKKCMDCGEATATKEDPRIPPLDTDVCLCDDCCYGACDQVIEECEQQIERMREIMDGC